MTLGERAQTTAARKPLVLRCCTDHVPANAGPASLCMMCHSAAASGVRTSRVGAQALQSACPTCRAASMACTSRSCCHAGLGDSDPSEDGSGLCVDLNSDFVARAGDAGKPVSSDGCHSAASDAHETGAVPPAGCWARMEGTGMRHSCAADCSRQSGLASDGPTQHQTEQGSNALTGDGCASAARFASRPLGWQQLKPIALASPICPAQVPGDSSARPGGGRVCRSVAHSLCRALRSGTHSHSGGDAEDGLDSLAPDPLHQGGHCSCSTPASVDVASLSMAAQGTGSVWPCKQGLLPLAPIAAAMAAFDRQSKQRQWAPCSVTEATGALMKKHAPVSGAAPEPRGPALVPCPFDSAALGVAGNEVSGLPPHALQRPPSPSKWSGAEPDPA